MAAQLADCLIGVVSQRLQYRPNVNMLLPECEVLMATLPIKNFIRNRDFFKIQSTLETGAEFGMWTFARYRSWLEKQGRFNTLAVEGEPEADVERNPAPPPPVVMGGNSTTPVRVPKAKTNEAGRIEIEPTEEFERILRGNS